jgi:hypothetical protein
MTLMAVIGWEEDLPCECEGFSECADFVSCV